MEKNSFFGLKLKRKYNKVSVSYFKWRILITAYSDFTLTLLQSSPRLTCWSFQQTKIRVHLLHCGCYRLGLLGLVFLVSCYTKNAFSGLFKTAFSFILHLVIALLLLITSGCILLVRVYVVAALWLKRREFLYFIFLSYQNPTKTIKDIFETYLNFIILTFWCSNIATSQQYSFILIRSN